MRINYDLSDLAAFLAVKSAGSFHLAAEHLSLSQSAVTRRVQKLEEALDVILFERTTRSVKPTLAAKRLEPRARALIEDATQTARAMRDESVAFAHQRSLVITLACIPTVVGRVLPVALSHFRNGGDTARLRLLDLSSNDVAEAVIEGDADFGLSSLPTLDPSLHFEALFDDEMVLVLPADHALAAASSVALADLKGESLILSARKTGNRVLVDDALARLEEPVHWTFETERSATALALVAGGAGLAILPRSLVQTFPQDQVRWRSLEGSALTRPVGLISRIGREDISSVARLKAAIRCTVQAGSSFDMHDPLA